MRFTTNGIQTESNSNVVVGNFSPATEVVERPHTPTHERTPGMVISKDKKDLIHARDKELVEQPIYDGTVSDFFGNRKAIWYGQGTPIDGCMTAREVFEQVPRLASPINKEPIYDKNGILIPDYWATIRECDRASMGIVGNTYQVVQNVDAFGILDDLVGEGVRLQNVGTWKNDAKVWVLGKTPTDYDFDGDKTEPYILLVNSFDGTGALKIAMVIQRVICQNQIALNLHNAKRSWSIRHTKSITGRIDEAREALGLADIYMKNLQKEYDRLNTVKMDKDKVIQFCKDLSPEIEGRSERQNRNAKEVQDQLFRVWNSAPDLRDRDQNATRFLQAVADVEDHRTPTRKTKDFASNRFEKIASGNHTLLDRAYDMVLSA